MSMDYGFLGEKESEEQLTLVLVIRERRHTLTWAMLSPRKGTDFHLMMKRAAKFIDQLGHNRLTLRCDNEPAIEALTCEIAQARQEGSRTVPERETTSGRKSVQRNHRTHCGARARTLKTLQYPFDARIGTVLVGEVRCVSDEQVRHQQRRKDADTQTAWTKGQHTDSGIWREDFVHACQTSKRRKVDLVDGRTRAANVRRNPESERSNTRDASSPVVSRRQ